MKKHLKILIATDYSKAAESAANYALRMAEESGADIMFIHVYESSREFPHELVALERVDDSPFEFELRKLQKYAEEAVGRLNTGAKKINYECVVKNGKASKEICLEALKEDADVIVVGTHGAAALRRVFLGSHTWDIIKKAAVPVLSIPQEALYSGIKNFVFAAEYREGEIPVVRFLTQWGKHFGAELTILHVTNDVFSKDFEHELLARFEENLRKNVPENKINIRLNHNEWLIGGLNEFCIKTKSSWLVMSPERSLLFERVFNPIASRTKEMTFYTHVPLLTIPDYNSVENILFWKKVNEEYALTEGEMVDKKT